MDSVKRATGIIGSGLVSVDKSNNYVHLFLRQD